MSAKKTTKKGIIDETWRDVTSLAVCLRPLCGPSDAASASDEKHSNPLVTSVKRIYNVSSSLSISSMYIFACNNMIKQ